jgi:16S rRNA G966 N2-methylase RsmD
MSPASKPHHMFHVKDGETTYGGDNGVSDEALLICYLRLARRKARVAAVAEALCLLDDLHAHAPIGGPLSEQGGVFWIALPGDALETAIARLPRLGYTCAVDTLESLPERAPIGDQRTEPQARVVRWRRKPYQLVHVYHEDPRATREAAVDRRTFLLETAEGEVRPVRGYRGDGHPSGRRGLPVCDARLLVNVVAAREGTLLLDPFAGTGGIVIEALASNATVVSADSDLALRHGLTHLGATHHVADARQLPFAEETFDAIATEPPYHEEAQRLVCAALREMARALKPGGRIAMLCAAAQADVLRQEAGTLRLQAYLDTPINRKGLGVAALAWRKD